MAEQRTTGSGGPLVFRLPRVGGDLCLDFTNTAAGRASGDAQEYLAGYADLVAWGRHTGGLDAA